MGEHQKADAIASEAKPRGGKETPNVEKEGASTPEQEAMNAAFEQFAAMTGNAEYLKNVGNFVAAALDPFGIDVQIDVQTPEDSPNTDKSTSSSSSSSDNEEEISNNQEGKQERNRKQSSEEGDWTVVADKEVENVAENPVKGNLYPSLPQNNDTEKASGAAAEASPTSAAVALPTSAGVAPPVSASDTPATESAPPAAVAVAPSQPSASHPDPKIQVALQAMMNMGFSNEGGWMTSLLEAKNGDIGKVLDILQPVRK